jgi:FemAB-related protein (PEP-CTERM system-associated)
MASTTAVESSLELRMSEAGADTGNSWDRYVEGHDASSLCHLFAWRGIVQESYRLETMFLLAEGDRGRIHGILPLVKVPGLAGPAALVSMPFLDQGGILADSPPVAAALLQAALDRMPGLGVQALDLRGGATVDSPAGDRFRALLPLPATRDELWQQIGPKVRNLVRKAERQGVTCERAGSGGLSEFYGVFCENMRSAGSPVHSLEFFEAILRHVTGRTEVYLVKSAAGDVIAGALAIRFRDTVTVPWASALPSARSLSPNYSLYWTALVDALESGARVFDFGRSSVGSGTLHFKKQWGTELQPLAWTRLDRSGEREPAALLDPRRNARLAWTWSRLPLAVANRIGPHVRRRLSN